MEHIHDKSVSFNLNFVAPDIILQAVLHVDTALIASRPDINIDDCQCLFYSFDTAHYEQISECLLSIHSRRSFFVAVSRLCAEHASRGAFLPTAYGTRNW
jgi:hypothetical protein